MAAGCKLQMPVPDPAEGGVRKDCVKNKTPGKVSKDVLKGQTLLPKTTSIAEPAASNGGFNRHDSTGSKTRDVYPFYLRNSRLSRKRQGALGDSALEQDLWGTEALVHTRVAWKGCVYETGLFSVEIRKRYLHSRRQEFLLPVGLSHLCA